MPLALQEYIERITSSGVLSSDELTAFLNASAAQKPQDGDALAKSLLRAKKLTPFQAQMLHQNKGKSLVLGNYLIVDKLGQGGMGMVLKAVHRRMERTVALKVLSPTVTKAQDMLQRFHREVRAAARLTHANIVAAFDADEAKGTHYLVMEYVNGIDLAAHVKKNGPLALDQAVNCILQAARGLKYAHDHGVVHRDIKPANLLLDSSGTVKILDMGLARLDAAAGDIGAQPADLTSTGSIMGTVDYMSPEQALDTKKANAQSDVYSLGCALHYLLTGKAVYAGDTVMKRLLAHREHPIPHLAPMLTARGFAADAAGRVERVFRKMVAKKPEERYADMGAVVADLEACLKGVEPAAIPISAPAPGDQQLQSFLSGLSASDIIAGTKTATQTRTATQTDSATHLASAISDTAVRSGRSGLTHGRRKRKSLLEDPRVWMGAGGALVVLLAVLIPLLAGGPGGIRVELNDPSLTVVVPLSTGNIGVNKSQLIELPAGTYTLNVSWPGGGFSTRPVEVADGAVVDVSVKRTAYSVVAMLGATKIGGVELPVQGNAAFGTNPGTSSTPGMSDSLAGTLWKGGSLIETGHPTAEQGVDNALWFDGATTVRETTLRMLPASEFTIEGWVTPQMTQPVHSLVVGGNGTPWITIRPELAWGFEGGAEMAVVCISSAGDYRPNERTHVAGVFDNGEVRLYLDGKLAGRADAPAKEFQLPQFGLIMGAGGLGSFQGVLDEVRISSVARYKEEFQPALRFEPDAQTLALFHFDEGKANLAGDATGRGHHAIIEGERYEWVKIADAPVAP